MGFCANDNLINTPGAETTDESSKVRVLDVRYGESISALKAVYAINGRAFIASSDNTSINDRMLGVVMEAGNIGYLGKVQVSGEMEDASWNWGNGAIYLGINGNLTQTPPIIGFNCQVGVAISPTKMIVGIKNSVLIA